MKEGYMEKEVWVSFRCEGVQGSKRKRQAGRDGEKDREKMCKVQGQIASVKVVITCRKHELTLIKSRRTQMRKGKLE